MLILLSRHLHAGKGTASVKCVKVCQNEVCDTERAGSYGYQLCRKARSRSIGLFYDGGGRELPCTGYSALHR